MKKILILTTQFEFIEEYDIGNIGAHSNWGMIELRKKYDTEIISIGNTSILKNTKIVLNKKFDVLYMHNTNPFRLFPIQILKSIFPFLRGRYFMSLCHAGIYGKSNRLSASSITRKVLSWIYNGYDKLLFFSPESLKESVIAGLEERKCQVIHWGVDLSFVDSNVQKVTKGNYWLSTGKELRDFETLDLVKNRISREDKVTIIKNRMPYKKILKLTAECAGILVIPQIKALNYCTGLTCIMDAFVFGKPIISVRNPYFPFNIEDEGCGIYVNPESPNEIIKAIKKIDADAELYSIMSNNSKRLSKKYNMDIFRNELYQIIDNK